MSKHKFIVEIEIPEESNITDMRYYIWGAVESTCGSLSPYSDPLFHIDRDSIKVTHVTKVRAHKLLKGFE